ncbi:amino acid ABC transporter substrate-binding protein [Xanthobacter sp. TB0139]|uniref:amino acid ABC transporter substrate-binding protein n=1 Tax=Xanthobacter sp. TB0139 TaxID=3459178 RepID=UPI00403A1A45
MKRLLLAAVGSLFLAAAPASAAQASTLDEVKARGALNCGVTQGLPGFSYTNDKGEWAGMDVDFCRAIAAAIFDDPAKVKFSPLSAKDRFTALAAGAVDVLSRNTTWTMSRDTTLGFNFAGVSYYDGQGFLARKSLELKGAKDLEGASICVQSGTSNEVNVADYFRAEGMSYKEVRPFDTFDAAITAYETGRCDVFSADKSQLAALRLKLTNPAQHVLLPETISKEPLGPLVRHGDDRWFDLVKWTYFALVNAEELGITAQNVDEKLKSSDPRVKRLLGTEGKYGEDIGLTANWVVRMVRAVGNYGEIYDRNVGPGTPLDIERGINNLWTKGGLHYGMPVR